MRECRAEGCPHIAADGCDYCKHHAEPSIREGLVAAVAQALRGHPSGFTVRETLTEAEIREVYRRLTDAR